MLNNNLKINLIILIVIISNSIGCNDPNVVNVYNKLTQPYRENESDYTNLLSDTTILIKIIDLKTKHPVEKAKVKLILPSNVAIEKLTDKYGYSVFNFPKVTKGNYTAEILTNRNGVKYSHRENFYLQEKNNPVLIIYVFH